MRAMMSAYLMTLSKAHLSICVFCFLCVPAYSQSLKVVPSKIRAGENATLTWDTAGAPAFLFGYGKKVTGTGSVTVSPSQSTIYVLLTISGQSVNYAAAPLLVEGAKGDDGFPSLHDFDDGPEANRSGLGYIDFQSLVWSALQGLGYAVRGEFVAKRPYVTVYTSYVLRPDLISRNENIRSRRLAFAVEIREPVGTAIGFAVRPRLEFQYRGEDDWRPDKEHSSVAQNEAAKLVDKLRSMR
jgi:hypothetical protein